MELDNTGDYNHGGRYIDALLADGEQSILAMMDWIPAFCQTPRDLNQCHFIKSHYSFVNHIGVIDPERGDEVALS